MAQTGMSTSYGVSASWQGKRPYRAPVVDQKRERTIARLSVLKSAAAFGASRPDLKSADVLRIADAWLAWVES